MKLFFAFLFILVGLCGCSFYPKRIERLTLAGPVSIQVDNAWSHLPQEVVHQRVTEDCRGTSSSYRAVMELTHDSLTVVGMSLMGTRGFLLSFDGSLLSFNKSLLFRRDVDPERLILAEFLLYSDRRELHRLTTLSGLELHEQRTGWEIKNAIGSSFVEIQRDLASPMLHQVTLAESGCSVQIQELSRERLSFLDP